MSVARRTISNKAESKPSFLTPFQDLQAAMSYSLRNPSTLKSPKQIADDIGLSLSQLYNSCNPHLRHVFPARRLVAFMASAGPGPVLKFFCDRFGFTVIPPQKRYGSVLNEIFKTTNAWMKLSSALQLYVSGKGKEAAALSAECDAFIDSIVCLKMSINNKKRGRK